MHHEIAVVAANGKAGQLIVKEALAQGLDVTAIVRHTNHSLAQRVIEKDLFDLTRDDLAGFDAVVDAFGAWTPETLPLHSSSLKHLCDTLSGTKVRLLVVGGAGSLYTDKTHTLQLVDTPDFPSAFKPLATAMGKGPHPSCAAAPTSIGPTSARPRIFRQMEGAQEATYLLAKN